ncbi:MAG: hypothetical protein HUJ98_12425, partial [Bacteroidaceae bacterium]|nr:hypothetical protein [Bacteroidaceae bacterium]
MNKNVSLLLMAITVLFAAASCIKTQEVDNSIYTDCAITSFSINDIVTTYTTKDRFGDDSTYTKTVTGSSYAFTIDHVHREIFNNDSLPLGTDVTHVICSISADGSVVYKKNDTEPVNENDIEWGSTTDSINFVKPVTFRVRAYNLLDYRDYTVHLNVHQCDSFETVWKKIATAYPGYELETPRAVTFAKKVAVFG